MTDKNRGLIQAEHLYQMELAGTPRLSPDGSKVVFSQQRIDKKTEKKYSNLWLIDVKKAAVRQITFGDQKDIQPRWSPDGQFISFLSNRGKPDFPPQIHLLPLEGGEASRLTEIDGSIESYIWSPDGKKFVCVIKKTDPEEIERRKDPVKKELGVVSRRVERVFFKLDGSGYRPIERSHLWIVDAKSGKGHQITNHGVFDETDPAWSPDSKTIAFISNRQPDPDFASDMDGLYLIPAAGGEIKQIATPDGGKHSPVFSPDGKLLAYVAQEKPILSYLNHDLWIVPIDGTKPAKNLTKKLDVEVSSWTINDQAEPEFMGPIWSIDGKSIFFQICKHGRTELHKLEVATSQTQSIITEDGVVGSVCFDRDQKTFSYMFGTLTDPGQVCIYDMASAKSRCLTKLNQSWLSKLDLGQTREVWYKGTSGNDLQGWILTPPGFDPKKKYPSILYIHGGPLTQYGFYFMHEFYYLAAQGYVVYFTNPRGGRGYGEAHAKAIWGSWGGVDYADLMAFCDLIEKEPYIDKKRMGAAGGSYGGFMTLWIAGHTTRFQAIVSQRCVFNLISMWGSSDFNWGFQYEANARQPFVDLQKFWDMSPIKYIGNAKTPTMIIHNENDMRCPIEQGEQAFVSLKSLGVDTEMVRFPDEFHGLSRNRRTDRRIARLNAGLRWFDRYLKV
ncbi:MAG TPA: S9 family peptidase [Longilinea sp.]|nr:S9 family peptidase [Longilinea sp.]